MRVLIVAKSDVVKPGRNLTYPDRLGGRVGSYLTERTGADQPMVPSQHYRTSLPKSKLIVMRVLIVAKSNVVKPGRNLTYPDRGGDRVGSYLPERTGADQPTVRVSINEKACRSEC